MRVGVGRKRNRWMNRRMGAGGKGKKQGYE